MLPVRYRRVLQPTAKIARGRFVRNSVHALVGLALVAGMGLTASTASAATYYVATSGNNNNPGTQALPWLTIQKAADTMAPGDTVFIRGGTYNARVTLTISGTSASRITYKNFPNEVPVLDGTGITGLGQNNGLFSINTRSYVTVSGLTIQNSERAGILVGNAGNVTIEDCVIHDTGLAGDSGSGIWSDGKTGTGPTIFRRNTIYNTNPGGITVWTGNHGGYFLIENNLISNWTGDWNYDGIQGGDAPYVIIRNNIVHSKKGLEGDYIDWGGNEGVGLTHHIVYDNNLVYRGTGPTANAQVKINTEPHDVIIRRNVLHQIQLTFYGRPFTRTAIYNNTISEGTDAIFFWNSDVSSATNWGGITFRNNLLAFTTDYLLFHGNDVAPGVYPSMKFENNLYRFSGKGIYWFSADGAHAYGPETPGTAGVAAFNTWRTAMGQEPTGGLRTEQSLAQLFVNSAARDFRPAPGSAAIDAGRALTFARGAGTNSTQLTVDEWWFFIGDWAGPLGVAPDTIMVGSTLVPISSINETTGVITLANAVSWTDRTPIFLGAYGGSAPDIGAIEVSGPATPAPAPPNNIRIVS